MPASGTSYSKFKPNNMNISFSKKFFVGMTFAALLLPCAVFAQTTPTTPVGSSDASKSNFQLVPCNGAVTGSDPLGGTTDVTGCDFAALLTTVQRIINLLLYASMFIAVTLIVYAGFEYLTAGGDTGKVKKAHQVFKAVVIGMIISFTSWAVVYYVITVKLNGTDTLLQSSFSNAIPLGKQ